MLRLIDLRKPSRAVPVMFYVNELCERLSVPRLCFKAEQLSSLMTARSLTNDDEAALAETVKLFTMIAASEWKRHHDDVLWDAAEAKRLAKEEDEQGGARRQVRARGRRPVQATRGAVTAAA